jgi:sporulation protein YlmC with PRC-barrel domain
MAVINLTQMTGKDVYTRNAKFVGKIDDTMVDTEKGNIYGFAVSMAKDSFLFKMLASSEGGVTKKTILIPYKEVLACDSIIIVTVPKQYEKAEAPPQPSEEEEIPLPGME